MHSRAQSGDCTKTEGKHIDRKTNVNDEIFIMVGLDI